MPNILYLIILLCCMAAAAPVGAASHYALVDHAGLPADELARIGRRQEARYQQVVDFLGADAATPEITYHIYPTFEAKGLATGDTRIAHLDPDMGDVHVVISDWIRGDDSALDAQLLIRHQLGRSPTRLLEIGLSTYFAHDWRARGYEYWAARLYSSGNCPRLADLLDNAYLQHESYLVAEPLAATFIAYSLDVFGRDVLLELYAEWVPDPNEISTLERGWHDHLDRLVARLDAAVRRDRETFPRTTGFQKGFCHAHEGYQIFNGYLSKKSDEALVRLADLGTNAVSITPFTYMRDPTRPEPLRFSSGAGAENDESVIHSSHTARALGMAVMLKPHVWLHRSWPGEIEMQSDADWERWFAYYYRWIRHYALLGEMYDMEILCIGVELSKATVGNEARWREIIKRLRGLYSGSITYAANWGKEFENVTVWDDLDFIGINCYYPLSDAEDPSVEELRAGADAMLDRVEAVHEEYDKPVVFTEIGFTSTPKPWQQPHAPRKRIVNLDHQAQCYAAVFEALHARSWCNGIYWWKWPSFLEYGGRRHTGFTPNKKPAEAIVRDWYGRVW